MRLLCSLITGAIFASSAFAGNIVLNPGFEANDFALPDWTPGLSFFANTDGLGPHSGRVFAATDCVGASCTTDPARALSQHLATTATTYTLSFFYDLGSSRNDMTGNFAELRVLWGTTQVLDVSATNQPNPGYVSFSMSGLPGDAVNGVDLIFFGRNDPSQLGVDDVCVVAAGDSCSAAPEPRSLELAGGAIFVAIGVLLRRRRTVR